ncbi:MAG TPA: diiron oxygenase [Candidatus Limnocylindria bacterium]|nr:diiron oxygenase [Candidatus Limnocylindria bacterium]
MITTPIADALAVPREERVAALDDEHYAALLARLSHQSVVKHYDAFADIAWDAPEMRIDPDDSRWILSQDDPLGRTAWYRSQPPGVCSRIGLHMICTFMQIGIEFESVLQRGLLNFAQSLPHGAPEFRYAYHEVIEEGQHSLMFAEFVRRAGLPVRGLQWWQKIGAAQVMRFGRTFPELFFVFVLGGEDPIDHVQRRVLASGRDVHPLIRRIMQIHVTEEARHLCFARHFLRRRVPQLSGVKRFILSRRAPIILAIMSQMMMRPSPTIVRTYGIPPEVIREAYTHNPEHRARTQEAVAKVRSLLAELGLYEGGAVRVWKLLGLAPPPATA